MLKEYSAFSYSLKILCSVHKSVELYPVEFSNSFSSLKVVFNNASASFSSFDNASALFSSFSMVGSGCRALMISKPLFPLTFSVDPIEFDELNNLNDVTLGHGEFMVLVVLPRSAT